jgi:hypothetical protein
MKKIFFLFFLFLMNTSVVYASELIILIDDVYALVSKPCHNGNNGKIDIQINNMEGQFDIKWFKKDKINGDKKLIKSLNGIYFNSKLLDLNNVDEGLYIFSIENNECGKLDLEINVESFDEIVIPDPTINTDCISKASIVFNKKYFSGGVAPYTFKWSNGETTSDIAILSEGSYKLTVTDVEGCSASKEFNVKFSELTIIPWVETDCDGTEINLGLDPSEYIITWKIFNNHEPKFDNLSTIHVVDNYKYSYEVKTKNLLCKAQGTIDLYNAYIPIKISEGRIIPSCSGPNGSIKFLSGEISGGTGQLSYLWSNGQTTQDITNLMPGTYTITVTDYDNCTKEREFNTSPNGGIWFESAIIQNSCTGSTNGEIYLIGVLPNVDIAWDNGSTGNHLVNILPGEYCCTMTLENCKTIKCFTVKEIPSIPIIVNETIYPSCQGNLGTGSIELEISGGHPPINVSWTDSQDDTYRDGLKAGFYKARIEDECNSIEKTFEVKLIGTPQIVINSEVKNGIEGGNASAPTGSIILTVTGGTGSFSYKWYILDEFNQWDLISENKNISNAKSGKYKVEVTDLITGCSIIKQFYLKNSQCSAQEIFLDARRSDNGDSKCDGPPGSISITHFFGTFPSAPVEITVSGENYSYKKILKTDSEINDFQLISLTNLKRQTYTINTKDACNRTGQRIIDLCVPCNGGLEYDISDEDHVITFKGIDLRLKVQCACTNDNCEWWTYLGFLTYYAGLNRTLVSVEGCPPVGMKYTFTWPDGEVYEITGEGGNWLNNYGLTCDDEGKSYYVIPDNEIGKSIIVKVSREDGCGEIEVPISIDHDNEELLFHPSQVGKTQFDIDYYGEMEWYKVCSSKPAEPSYSETSDPIDIKYNHFFVFKPNNPGAKDPCQSGGTFSGFIFDENGKASLNKCYSWSRCIK